MEVPNVDAKRLRLARDRAEFEAAPPNARFVREDAPNVLLLDDTQVEWAKSLGWPDQEKFYAAVRNLPVTE